MSMDDENLKKLFETMPSPEPDQNRKKEALNLAVAAFEAQKSANLQNNSKNTQGLSILRRLISQMTTKRSDNMNTSSKRYIYGGLATACVALLVGTSYITTHSTRSGGGSTEREKNITIASADLAQPVSPSMQQAIEDKNLANADEALRSSGSAMPVPVEPPKGAMPVPTEQLAMAESAASPSPAPPPVQMAAKMSKESSAMGGMVARREMEPPVAVGMTMAADAYAPVMQVEGRDNFEHVEQNSVMQVKAAPVSTFSIDVDTASYAFVRQTLDQGVLPQPDAVRIEEMVNYFDYAYPGPQSKEEPFKTNVVVKPSPWNDGKKLITVGIKGFDVEKTAQPDSNLVFLLDTSGSMNEPKKLPLLKQSLSMLLDSLKPTDKVSIVVYAGSAGTILQPTPVSEKGKIMQALQNLEAGGSTAGGEGIRLAYQMAQANFEEKSINRVILATDGDFNVGITDPDELQGFVEREREKGIFLSVLGFGQGNYNDAMMQKLAQNGNGVAAYIDTLNEARKVLVQEAGAALFPIAKDVKIQVEFNPNTVSEYRLVGYETRALNTEDFNNDKVDAGDIGAGAEVTAIYEITPVGVTPMIDESRYAPKAETKPADAGNEYAFVKVRYKLPKENTSKLITTPVPVNLEVANSVIASETNWAEAVAGFAQLLKGGKFTGKLTYDDILKQAQENKGADPYGYRAEFINLIYKAKTAASLPAQSNGSRGYEGGPVIYNVQ